MPQKLDYGVSGDGDGGINHLEGACQGRCQALSSCLWRRSTLQLGRQSRDLTSRGSQTCLRPAKVCGSTHEPHSAKVAWVPSCSVVQSSGFSAADEFIPWSRQQFRDDVVAILAPQSLLVARCLPVHVIRLFRPQNTKPVNSCVRRGGPFAYRHVAQLFVPWCM